VCLLYLENFCIYRDFGRDYVTKWLCESRVSRDLRLEATCAQMHGSFGICSHMTRANVIIGIHWIFSVTRTTHRGAKYLGSSFLDSQVVLRYSGFRTLHWTRVD